MNILAASGHRPSKLGGYGVEIDTRIYKLAHRTLEILRPDQVISGMALGWDTAWAQAAVDLDIPLTAAIPFAEYSSKWPALSRAKFDRLCTAAQECVVVSTGGFTVGKLQIRNEWMVDRCSSLIVLWDGSPSGTGNCVKYAQAQHKANINLWSVWAKKNCNFKCN